MTGNTERSANQVTALLAKSNAGDNADVIIWADPSTHRLLVNASVTVGAISGDRTNNTAIPGATNIGALVGVATAAAPSYTEGYLVGLSTDLAGALRVTGSLSVGGTTDNSAFTAGTSTGTPAMGFYHSTIDAVTDGRSAVVGITAKRAMLVTLQTSAGADTGVAASPIQVSLANNGANATAVLVNVASGGIASGAIASGAIASGAVASGAVASGAFAAGSIAAGAVAAGASSFVKLEDVASAGGDAGVPAMAIQTATPVDTAAEADYVMLQMSGGRLWVDASGKTLTVAAHAVTVASGGVASGAIASGAFASGSIGSGAVASGAFASGSIGSGAIASGAVASGAFASGSIASGAIVAGAIAAGATSFVKLEDVGSADADAGVPAMAVRKATPANTSGSDADYEFLQMANGRLWTQTSGSVATNVAIADNPVNLGAQAVSSENAAVTTARQVQLVADLVGKLIVLPYANPENFVSGAITSAMTGTTSTSLIAAPASGLRNYITNIVVSNAHATVGTDVIIQDGSGGTTLYTIPAAAVYGGASVTFPTPLRQPTTATAIYCANVTTGASTKVSATGYKGA